MKVGDLVKPGEGHGLRNESYRAVGIVLKRHPERPGWHVHVTIAWNDGDIEAEWPDYLELISERT